MNEHSQGSLAFQNNLYISKNPTRRWMHQERFNWVMNTLLKASSTNSRILEVGTGCGTYTKKLVQLFSDVTTIDINPDFIKNVQIQNLSAKAVIADIGEMQGNQKYDVVLMSEVLEHLKDPSKALLNIHSHLRDGGILILTTPNKFSTAELVARLLKVRLIAVMASKIYGEPVAELGHISLRTNSQLRKEFNKSGFNIVEHTNLAFYLPVIAEWGGESGKSFLSACATVLKRTHLFTSILWTQCYVLQRN